MAVDVGELVARFGVGAPTAPPRPLGGASSAAASAVDTARGRWVVKTVVPLGDWHARAIATACRLERAAWAAGVLTARRLEPPAPALGYWHDAGGLLVRVIEFVDGRPAPWPVDASLAAWTGRTLARVATLGLPGDLALDESAPLHPLAEWRSWVDEARAGGFAVAEPAGRLLPAVADATELVESALAARPPALLAHRDVSPANLLARRTGGYELLDWDHAGPAVPWWEAVHTAFRCASPPTRDAPTAPPSPAAVRATVEAYLAAGGPPGPADQTAFAGALRSMLAWAAYSLWLALGHRVATPERRARAAADVAAAAAALPAFLGSLDGWSRLLRA